MVTAQSTNPPSTPKPPSDLPADFHKPFSHNTHDTSSSTSSTTSYQANHPYWSHLLFPSHWKHLPDLSKGAGPFTTQLVHRTPSGHQVNWESRKHRKRLKQRIDSPNTQQSTHTAPDSQQQPPQPVPLVQRWFPFKPDHIAWWTAILFDLGSLCFVFSSICEFIPHIYDSAHLDTGYVGWTGFTGSVLFTVGAFFQFAEVLSAPIVAMYHSMTKEQCIYMRIRAYRGRPKRTPHNHPQHQQPQQQQPQANGSAVDGSSSNDDSHPSATRDNLSSLLYRLDFHVAWIQLIGTIAFNINTFAFSGSFQLTTPETTGLVDFCDVFASCCFTVSGYLSILEITHTLLPFKPLPITNSLLSIEWWLTWFNFLGGVGFLLNGIFIIYWPNAGQLQPAYPLLIGSVFFQCGSHLQYLEQSDTHTKSGGQPQPQQQRQQQSALEKQNGHVDGRSAEQSVEQKQQLAHSEMERGGSGGGGEIG